MSTTYDATTAQKLMTLSSIAYADSTGSLSDITASIEQQLSSFPEYAIGTDYTLAWGPVLSSDDNLMFVTRAPDGALQLVVRGTANVENLLQDLDTTLVPFAPASGTQVTAGFSDAFTTLCQETSDGQTLEQFLAAQSSAGEVTLEITGHSLGAALSALFAAWIAADSGGWGGSLIAPTVYAFACPTPGDKPFADLFGDNGTPLFSVVNPNDAIPFGYDRIELLPIEQIPIAPSEAEAAALLLIGADLALKGYAPVGQTETLPSVPIPAGSVPSWWAQVGDQHTHNSYLYLLQAVQVTIPPATVLSQHGTLMEPLGPTLP